MARVEVSDESECAADIALAKALAPEEIRPGDYVAPLFMVVEWPSWYRDDCVLGESREPLQNAMLPPCEPTPLKVVAVCLPLVLARSPTGEEGTLDIRRFRLARLERRFARRAWKAYRKRKVRVSPQA
jgi:hypothetical protein